MIWHIEEGQFCRQGINWRRNQNTQLAIIVKLWRACWYLRIRPKWMTQEPNSCKRIIWEFNWFHVFHKDGYERVFAGLWYNWNTRVFRAGSRYMTEEFLVDFIERNGLYGPEK